LSDRKFPTEITVNYILLVIFYRVKNKKIKIVSVIPS
jgi:hypothetical protein